MPSLSFVILRLSEHSRLSDPRYLLMYLRSPALQQRLATSAVAAVIPNISLQELRALPVWVPAVAEQAPFVAAFEAQAEKGAQLSALLAEQKQIAQSVWEAGPLAPLRTTTPSDLRYGPLPVLEFSETCSGARHCYAGMSRRTRCAFPQREPSSVLSNFSFLQVHDEQLVRLGNLRNAISRTIPTPAS